MAKGEGRGACGVGAMSCALIIVNEIIMVSYSKGTNTGDHWQFVGLCEGKTRNDCLAIDRQKLSIRSDL